MISLWRNSRGAVYVEFLLVFPPLLLLFLFILQSAILRATDIGVRHAASSTVRSAIVVLPDDPFAYEGQKENQLEASTGCGDGFASKFTSVLNTLGERSAAPPKGGKCPGGARLEAIRFAAIMRMLPFSPNFQNFLPEAMRGGLDSAGTAGWLAGAATYSYGATAVTFPDSEGSQKEKKPLVWQPDKPVTVRVSYLAHCGIPIARFFMCDAGHSINFGVDADFADRDLQGKFAARKRLKAAKPTLAAMKKSVGSSKTLNFLLFSGERFVVLSADATLPLSSAPYTYQKKGQ